MQEYDIVIIGAGPAGSNFARLIDSVRYKTLLVDGSDGHDKVCGGLLSPDAQNVLARYDLSLPKEILVSPQLFSVRTIDLSGKLTRHYRRSYMNVDRKKLDTFFKGLVPETVHKISDRCKRVSKTEQGYELELLSGKILRCKAVVGADGAGGCVRRSLFRDKKLYKYIAIQQWFAARETNRYYSCIFDNQTSSGCSWVFFKDGMMVFGGAFEAKNCREAFEEQKRKLIEQGYVEKEAFADAPMTEACLVSRPKLFDGVFVGKDGAFLVGEAAGFISPSSFEGISYALLSAEALADAFNSADDRKTLIAAEKKYRKLTRKLAVKIKIKCVKRPFMYNRVLRAVVMRSGITSIKLKTEDKK